MRRRDCRRLQAPCLHYPLPRQRFVLALSSTMHESVPQPRFVSLSTCDGDDVEYDVYYFYPSRNRVYQPARQASPWDTTLDNDAPSSADVSVLSLPSYSYNSDFVFPDPASVHGISTLGYSTLFRKGLWAQSRAITRRLDAFVARMMETCRSLKNRFRRRRTPPVA
ncbi:hypothetical protein LXA43DRAFT_600175 [Ganoderma leucocontextum]|nr:hypothetical protein LXA43DRAFT_600175 [Ganoderma leucocontextum]